MSRYDREVETVGEDGRRVIVNEGPSMIASRFFRFEEDEELRDELAAAIDHLLECPLAERRA